MRLLFLNIPTIYLLMLLSYVPIRLHRWFGIMNDMDNICSHFIALGIFYNLVAKPKVDSNLSKGYKLETESWSIDSTWPTFDTINSTWLYIYLTGKSFGFDFIDFWAVDFDYRDGQPFKHHWQAYRTRKDRSLATVSDQEFAYEKPGRYTACVKVVDTFGCDTSITVPIEV